MRNREILEVGILSYLSQRVSKCPILRGGGVLVGTFQGVSGLYLGLLGLLGLCFIFRV